MIRRSAASGPASRSAWRPAQFNATPASHTPSEVVTRTAEPVSVMPRTQLPNRTSAPAALNAILGLEAARLQVVARMDHARVASALMARGTRFLLQERDPHPTLGQVPCGACPDRTCSDHHDVRGVAQLVWPFSRRYAA